MQDVPNQSLRAVFGGAVMGVLMMAFGIMLSLALTPTTRKEAPTAPVQAATIYLVIRAPIALPDGTINGPMYTPTTHLVVPAHTLVSMTIVNQDLGDTSLPSGTPYATVTNVVGGVAWLDGVQYSRLDRTKVAHTFTIPQLGVNVPIPGDSTAGQPSLTVTFGFMSGSAGVYNWRCMDPCGTGPDGWGGPMSTMGQMMGTLTVMG